MQDRWRNERAKWWIFFEIAKWRRWRHAPQLTATAVIMDSRHRFSKRWHVADFKNIAGDDQTTLMVHRNSANIACPFRFYVYVCTIATVVPGLTAAAVATSLGWPGSIEIPQIRKFMPTKSSKTSRKTSFCCYEWCRDWRHCALFFFLLSLATAFVFTFEK